MRALLKHLIIPIAALLSSCTPAHTRHGPVSSALVPESIRHLVGRPVSAGERGVLDDKGLVISTDEKVPSFHLGYTALFKAHEPVYFTADALLHAIHRSYDQILADVESEALSAELATLLDELRRNLAGASSANAEARADLDVYLAVAASLLSGTIAKPMTDTRAAEVASLVQAAERADGAPALTLFGERHDVDVSMLKPRGHYTRSEALQRYFRATMWLGRVEIRVAQKHHGEWHVNRRALEGALLLRRALSDRAALAHRRLDEAMEVFVGPADSLSFSGLARATRAHGDLATLADADVARALENEAKQRIASGLLHPHEAPIDFLMLGQRYVVDSEVFSAVTYGRLEEYRMMPSPLDIGWGVFRNSAALALLAPELSRFHYRNALEAVAKRGEEAGPALWEGSIYHLWLGALKALSPDPTRDAALPRLMQSEAWSRRMLNTQLASWAELRHDTVLYAKQSYTSVAICAYPDAYVEPYPAFFAAVAALASRGGALVSGLDFGKQSATQKHIVSYFETLQRTAVKLREIAERERRKEPLLDEQLDFMNHAVSMDGRHAGCTIVWQPGGWYADLYYDRRDVTWHKPTIADVHTQPTDESGNPVGKVLHVGTGGPRLFTVTLDTCKGPRTYRGFVSSYHEVTTANYQRLTDEEWRPRVDKIPDVGWMSDLLAH
ncbi:Hypothetical protein A7982_11904 [Minicystis rosea]|nr:Hypothetical protein A7982_11904 [Minicystis rosea]